MSSTAAAGKGLHSQLMSQSCELNHHLQDLLIAPLSDSQRLLSCHIRVSFSDLYSIKRQRRRESEWKNRPISQWISISKIESGGIDLQQSTEGAQEGNWTEKQKRFASALEPKPRTWLHSLLCNRKLRLFSISWKKESETCRLITVVAT